MKSKAILASLFCAYLLTGGFLLLLALVQYRMDPGEKVLAAGITVIYLLSCMGGGMIAGKVMRKNRYLWGLVAGICYYVLLLVVSFLSHRSWNMTAIHALTTFLLCAGGGTLGGML